jgi:D-serine deaminase-like pyridoxal phosphate-dependent protein
MGGKARDSCKDEVEVKPTAKRLQEAVTPALVLDQGKLTRNVWRMHETLGRHRVVERPHVKTVKCVEAARLAFPDGGTGPITVSTLAEAEHFAAHGYRDMTYAVGLAPVKLPRLRDLVRGGSAMNVILDSPEAASTLRAFCAREDVRIPALIEIDTDAHRAGVQPESERLLEVARALGADSGTLLGGILTHAGSSYSGRTPDEIRAWARRERAGMLTAAARLREAGFPCPVVSVGSTPTALYGETFEGITEVRAGVYFTFDLVMAGLGLCTTDDIAISVLGSVIGHQREKGLLITDTGWMSLSRDRGTAEQPVDQGYGLVCDVHGRPQDDLLVVDCNQEHGIVGRRGGGALDVARFPVGTPLRILPNHACATGGQHDHYLVVDGADEVVASWPRVGGW